MCEITEKFNMDHIKRSLELAETLAKFNLTSRVKKHNVELKNEENDAFEPPKQVLLYLVR